MEEKYSELYEKLSRLQWLLQRHHMMNHAEHGPFADTTRGQGRVMAALKMQPEISTKDLSYLLGIRIPSLNELLNKLEKGGYIVRKPAEADKRVMLIHLTEKGRNTQPAENDYSSIFACLNAEEQTAFGEYLDRVIDALEAQVGNEQDEEEQENWLRAARSRMDDEQLGQFMAMRGGVQRRGGVLAHGFGPGGCRGSAPPNMPGAERFAADYDGPMPEGRCGFGFGRHHAGPNATPPKGPHNPEDK